jgi:hypothetical protein
MTIFFEHVGERGGAKNFPISIGTRPNGLKRFQYDDIKHLLFELSDAEREDLAQITHLRAPKGFQIWATPSGARTITKDLKPGDWFFLLETDRPGGEFYYGGRVIYRAPRELFGFSQKLWGEAKFPLIILLDGNLTNYSWDVFKSLFQYKTSWRMRGQTSRITREKLTIGNFLSEDDVVDLMLPMAIRRPESGLALDAADAERPAGEGQRVLREHLFRERSPALIAKFKASLASFACEICGFEFEAAYGELGKGFIEAHHIRPIGEREFSEDTSIQDLMAVCSNCHQMLHRSYPALTPAHLKKTLK